MAHKMSYRSTPCVFLSYVPSHKGYLCLHYTFDRFFICTHVKFHEAKFPFRTNSPPHSSLPISKPALIQMLPSPQLSPTPLPNSPSAASIPSIIQVHFISPDPEPSPSPPPQNTHLIRKNMLQPAFLSQEHTIRLPKQKSRLDACHEYKFRLEVK